MSKELVWLTVTISCNQEELSNIVDRGIMPFLKKRRNEYNRYQIFLNGFGKDNGDNLRMSVLLFNKNTENLKNALITYLSSIFVGLQIQEDTLDTSIENFSVPFGLSFLYSEEHIDYVYKLKEELSSIIMANVVGEEIINNEFIFSLAFYLNLGLIKAAEGIYRGEIYGLVEFKPEFIGEINPEVVNQIVADNRDLLTGFTQDILTEDFYKSLIYKWIEVCKDQFNAIVSKKENYTNIEVLKLYEFLLSLIFSHLSFNKKVNTAILYRLVKDSVLVLGKKHPQKTLLASAQSKIVQRKNSYKPKILYLYDIDDWAIHNVGKLWLDNLDDIECTFKNARFVSEHQFKNYDFVWFGFLFLYTRYNYDFDKSIIAIHDPIELDNQNNVIHILKKAKYIITISKELHDQLLSNGIHSQLINTKSIVSYSKESNLVTKKCDIHSIFNPSQRKNTTLMNRLRSRCMDEFKLDFDLKTGISVLSLNDYVTLLDDHEIYVCTSLMEGGPLPAMDAMHRGAVVLTTPVGQIQNLIEDGKNGFICRSENDFMEKIKLLANNLDLLHNMRKASLASIKKERSDKLIKNQVSTFISHLRYNIKFNLGGTGKGTNGWRTVNLVPGADIKEDILDIDEYCNDNSVDEFLMSHTYEHLPVVKIRGFLEKLLRKLKKGGKLTILHTDIKRTLELYKNGEIDFYCLRDLIFTPVDRRLDIYNITGEDLQGHKFMWGNEELRGELLYYGFSKVNILDGGTWPFDVKSFYPFQDNERYFGVQVPNLKVEAYK